MGEKLTRFEPPIRGHTSCSQLGFSTIAVKHDRTSYPKLSFLSYASNACIIYNKFRFNSWKGRSVGANAIFPVIPTLVQLFSISLASWGA